MNHIKHLVICLGFLFAVLSCSQEKVQKEKPNIIFIMTDDMGYETVSYNKVINFKTPNIDQLAREGVVFTNCDAQPLCVPTRVKLVTGQYNYRNYRGWGSFDLEFPAIGKMMQKAGYVTGAFGKWHLGKSPEELGFDEHCYFDGSRGDMEYSEFFKRYFYNTPLIEDGKKITAEYAPDKFNKRVLKFIDDHKSKKKPFFIYYPLSLAHNPFEPTPDSDNSSSKDWQQNFEDMVAYADKMIGKVIDKLKKDGLYDNTVIFYTADNGTKTLAHEMDSGEVIYGEKGIQMVDGVHVPLFIKYDGTHKVVDDLVDFTDFYPTLASLAGIPGNQLSDRIDGISLFPLLEGNNVRKKPFLFSVFHHPLSAYIRDKHYKFYFDGRLYNIVNDPRELRPYYACNDTYDTKEARKRLKTQLTSVLDDEQLSAYKTKKQLQKAFGDYQVEKEDNYLLRSYMFHCLEYTPRTEKLHCDLSNYLSDKNGEYRIRFERGMGKPNSGLAYADAVIKSVKVLIEGKTVFEKECDTLELITRRNVENLRKKGNPIIAFTREGDNNYIVIGKIPKKDNEKVELEVEVAVSNPENQWGDRLLLSLYLDKENNQNQ
ncbi:MAG: sulfatase-like hydrolase/transferase [Bacteroidota bacterium]